MPPPTKAAAALGISFRPETDDHRSFVAALYASTRRDEFAQLGWPAEMLAAFLAEQHAAQRAHYRTIHPGAEWLIVEQDGAPIGRLYLETRSASLHVIDISLIAKRRGQGIGGAILADLIDHGEALERAVTLQVEQANRASRLYRRLGFRTVRDNGIYQAMERPRGRAATEENP